MDLVDFPATSHFLDQRAITTISNHLFLLLYKTRACLSIELCLYHMVYYINLQIGKK